MEGYLAENQCDGCKQLQMKQTTEGTCYEQHQEILDRLHSEKNQDEHRQDVRTISLQD